MSATIIFDVDEAGFAQQVVERSHRVPVLVDFWAAWCGPCRSLGPVLEAAVTARAGAVELAKLDTDANQAIAGRFGIQGIPAVKAFAGGVVVDEFVGAIPRPQVERFIDGLVPSEVDALIAEGGEERLRRAVELEPANVTARVALAREVHRAGRPEEALELLEGISGVFAAEGLAARIALESDAALAPAFAALDRGETDAALDALIGAIGTADAERKVQLRQAVVAVLDELGVEHPLARDARRRLATALF